MKAHDAAMKVHGIATAMSKQAHHRTSMCYAHRVSSLPCDIDYIYMIDSHPLSASIELTHLPLLAEL